MQSVNVSSGENSEVRVVKIEEEEDGDSFQGTSGKPVERLQMNAKHQQVLCFFSVQCLPFVFQTSHTSTWNDSLKPEGFKIQNSLSS